MRETPARAAVAPTIAYGPVVMHPLRSGQAARITLLSRFALVPVRYKHRYGNIPT